MNVNDLAKLFLPIGLTAGAIMAPSAYKGCVEYEPSHESLLESLHEPPHESSDESSHESQDRKRREIMQFINGLEELRKSQGQQEVPSNDDEEIKYFRYGIW